MNCKYDKSYVSSVLNMKYVYDVLMNELEWLKVTDARYEYFMSTNEITYTYGVGNGIRTYTSKPFHYLVKFIMEKMNKDFSSEYNICFLNRYDNEKMWLGWHADDSPEIDLNHPIGVISIGAEREIWVKEIGYKGEVPECDRFLLNNGSLFVMPSGFQKTHLHKIPKWSRPCGPRISLTFRKYIDG